VIAWRKDMESRKLKPASIRRKLSALSSLFDYLCERNAVTGNPVDGVKRPMANGNEGSTPALGDRQARKLLEAPSPKSLKGLRDRAILATLLYHGMRREELCSLRVKDIHSRQGVWHFRVHGKRDKIRFVPVNPAAQRLIDDYLSAAGHRHESDGPLFRPVKKCVLNKAAGRPNRIGNPRLRTFQHTSVYCRGWFYLDSSWKSAKLRHLHFLLTTKKMENSCPHPPKKLCPASRSFRTSTSSSARRLGANIAAK
jgi:integrase